MDQRADQTEFLLHAAGKILHGTVTELVQSRHAEQFFLTLRQIARLHQPQPGEKIDVFFDRQIGIEILPQPLRHETQPKLDAFGSRLGIEVGAEDLNRASLITHHARDGFHGTAFARTIRTDQPKQAASGNVKIDTPYRMDFLVILYQPAYADDWRLIHVHTPANPLAFQHITIWVFPMRRSHPSGSPRLLACRGSTDNRGFP